MRNYPSEHGIAGIIAAERYCLKLLFNERFTRPGPDPDRPLYKWCVVGPFGFAGDRAPRVTTYTAPELNEQPRRRRPKGTGTVTYHHKDRKWIAYSPGAWQVRKYLGSFATEEQAEAAVREFVAKGVG